MGEIVETSVAEVVAGVGFSVAGGVAGGVGIALGESAKELLWKLTSKAIQRQRATNKEVCLGNNFHFTTLD